MKKISNNSEIVEWQAYNQNKSIPQEYPLYPVKDDIYNRSHEEPDIDPEDISKKKTINAKAQSSENYDQDLFGSNLDVPGSELDDMQEAIGSEDEENNYYSFGSDMHNGLDEDRE